MPQGNDIGIVLGVDGLNTYLAQINLAQKATIDKMGQAQKAVGGVGASFNSAAQQVPGLGQAMSLLTNPIGLVVAGVAAIGATVVKSVQAFSEFETGLATLQSITGATGETLDKFSDAAKHMGLTTSTSAVDALKAMELIGSAKPELLESADALLLVTENARILAKASGLDLPQAATALTDAMNQFGAGASESAKFIDVLAGSAKFGAAAIPDVTEALLQFGVIASSSGISIEQSAGAIEALAEKGIKGAKAGIGLRNIFSKLAAGADDTNPAIVGLETALDNLGKKNLSVAELTKMFGLENQVAAQIMIKNRDRVDELAGKVNEVGGAYAAAAINSNTFAEKMAIVGNVLKTAFIIVGEKVVGFLNLLAEKSQPVIDAFLLMKKPIDDIVLGFQKLMKGLGPAVESFDLLGKTMKIWGLAIEIATAPLRGMLFLIGKVIGIIPNFIAALDGAWEAIRVVGQGFAQQWEGITDVFSGNVKQGFSKIYGVWDFFGSNLVDAFKKGYNDRMKDFEIAADIIEAVEEPCVVATKVITDLGTSTGKAAEKVDELRKALELDFDTEIWKQQNQDIKETADSIQDLYENLPMSTTGENPIEAGINRSIEAMKKAQDEAKAMADVMRGIGDTMKQAAVNTFGTFAEEIGRAIAKGEGFGAAFKKLVRGLLVEAPKMLGMAMLNASTTAQPWPFALALAAGGLALIGLSGLAGGMLDKQSEQSQLRSPSSSGAIPGQGESPQLAGLSQFSGEGIVQNNIKVLLGGHEFRNVVVETIQKHNELQGN